MQNGIKCTSVANGISTWICESSIAYSYFADTLRVRMFRLKCKWCCLFKWLSFIEANAIIIRPIWTQKNDRKKAYSNRHYYKYKFMLIRIYLEISQQLRSQSCAWCAGHAIEYETVVSSSIFLGNFSNTMDFHIRKWSKGMRNALDHRVKGWIKTRTLLVAHSHERPRIMHYTK